jgi:hypothetical protein
MSDFGRKSLYWKLRRKTTAKTTAAYNGLSPLASVGVSIKFVVGWLTDILDVLHHDDCPAGDPPCPNSPQTPATTLERVIKGIIGVRCLKVRARSSSCKKEVFNWIYYAAASPRWKLVYGDRVGEGFSGAYAVG